MELTIYCQNCGKVSKEYIKCTKCNYALYCSLSCRMNNLNKHRSKCKDLSEIETFILEMINGNEKMIEYIGVLMFYHYIRYRLGTVFMELIYNSNGKVRVAYEVKRVTTSKLIYKPKDKFNCRLTVSKCGSEGKDLIEISRDYDDCMNAYEINKDKLTIGKFIYIWLDTESNDCYYKSDGEL